MDIKYHDSSVVVSGGTGSATVTVIGGSRYEVQLTIIDAATDTKRYDYVIKDKDSYVVAGRPGLIGDNSIQESVSLFGNFSITISGDDGTYAVRHWLKYHT